MTAPLGPWASTSLPERGTGSLGSWDVAWHAQPYAGQAPGGDRFALGLGPEGALCFLLADAAGHGHRGNAVWTRHGQVLAAGWAAFLAGGQFSELVDPLDASLVSGEASDSLCLTLGRWRPSGVLEFATCGYGTHALVATHDGPWVPDEPAFGLKLGWFGPERRRTFPRGFVRHELPGVDRLILVTDGLLVDDHRDPAGTLAGLALTNARCALLAPGEVLQALLDEAPAPLTDDLTLLSVSLTVG